MAHGYRNLQQWNQWLTQHNLGSSIIKAEQQVLSLLLKNHFGKNALLIGTPEQQVLLDSTTMPRHALLSPLTNHHHYQRYIEGDLHELPILTGSIDLVLLPHTLEFVDNARQLLSEACRIIKPEGLIVISGFNPYSAWGIKKYIGKKNKRTPWAGRLIPPYQIRSWLNLADFLMEKQTSAMFRPPINHANVFEKLHFLEKVGNVCFPKLGGVYIILARAKVIPLTPIRMKWKQQFGGIRISTSISGHIARHSK